MDRARHDRAEHSGGASARMIKSLAITGGLALALSLSGCAEGVELNGKIFDAIGISPAAQASAKTEPKLADRAPLVLPPSSQRLPDPNNPQVQTSSISDKSWPVSAEDRENISAAERLRLHTAYCNGQATWKERALRPERSGAASRSPYGSCNPLFGTIGNDIGGDQKEVDPLVKARNQTKPN